MPKKPFNFSNAIIYKIVCKDPDVKDLYVGSTTNFTKRKHQHKTSCINPNDKCHNIYVYQFIRENSGWDNWDMVAIERYTECKDKLEMHKRERVYIETLGATLNKQVPSRTQQEYKKQYREQNKDKIKAHEGEKIKCECGSEIRQGDKSRHFKTEKHQNFLSQQTHQV